MMARAGVGGVLVVSPFDCVWLEADDLRFPHPGRGRISFEVRGENDATVILKDSSGHRHYRTDTTRNYTVVIGSHRNRRIRIEADGKSVADVDAPESLEPQRYRRFWINVWDGVVSVGKVETDGDEISLQFVDSCPNLAVRFAGLSSWDKHVAYRNVKMSEGQDLPLASDLDQPDLFAAPTPLSFLNSPTFADICFQVGPTKEIFYAHRIVLACSSWPCVKETGPMSQEARENPSEAHCTVPACHPWLCLQQAGSIPLEGRAGPGEAATALPPGGTGQAGTSLGMGGSSEVDRPTSSQRHTGNGLNSRGESCNESRTQCNLISACGVSEIGEGRIKGGLRVPYGHSEHADNAEECRNGGGARGPAAQGSLLESSESSSFSRGPQAPEFVWREPQRLVHVDVPQGSPEGFYVFLRHLYGGAVDLAAPAPDWSCCGLGSFSHPSGAAVPCLQPVCADGITGLPCLEWRVPHAGAPGDAIHGQWQGLSPEMLCGVSPERERLWGQRSPQCPGLEISRDSAIQLSSAECRASSAGLNARRDPEQLDTRAGGDRTGWNQECYDGSRADCRREDGAGQLRNPDAGLGGSRAPGQLLRATAPGAPGAGATGAGAHGTRQGTEGQDQKGESSRAHEPGQDMQGQDRVGESSRAQLDKACLRRFCRSAELADVVLSAGHCGSCSLLAHSLVLSTSSPVLHRMLCSDMSEGRSHRIVLGETSCAAVAALLHFIYCGDLPASLADRLANSLSDSQAEPCVPTCDGGQPALHGPWSDDSDMPGWRTSQPGLRIGQAGSNMRSSQALHSVPEWSGACPLCADPSSSRQNLLLDLLILSDRLCMRPLCALAQDALASTLTPEVALKALATAAQLPGCKALHARAGHFCAVHFEACVAQAPHDWLDLELEEVCSILEDSSLSLDEEHVLLDCLVSWALSLPSVADWRSVQAGLEDPGGLGGLAGPGGQGAPVEGQEKAPADSARCSLDSDPEIFEAHAWSDDESAGEGREAHLERLLDFVSFSSLPVATLRELAGSPLVHVAPSILEKAQVALHCLAGPPRTRGALPEDGSLPAGADQGSLKVDKGKRAVYSWRPRGVLRSLFLRQPQEVVADLQYICDGDENGLLFFAGTSYGRHPWMNPVMLGVLAISASSPPSRHTDGRVLASRNYAATSFAGPMELDGAQSAWWMVDLGAQRMLMCNHYSLRQDGSASFPRSWILEGSKDGSNWTALREHFNDATLSQPGLYGSWPVEEPTACRYFRIRLLSPSGSNAQWQLHTCYVEFYGLLF